MSRSSYAEILDAAWQSHLAPRAPDAPTVISTFAGGGGSSLGYSMAGYRELLAVEWDAHAVQCFRANFHDVPVHHGDIAKLSVEDVLDRTGLKSGELDVFDGSPPCQGFSTAGKREFGDDRNQLFREYCRLLRGLRPRAFVMENVSGMVKGSMRLIFAECLRELKATGYDVSVRLLDASYFHVPQERQRMIFVGVRADLGVRASHPSAQASKISLRAAIGGAIERQREGFGPTRLTGVRNEEFANKWRSADRPSCTIVKSRPPILLLSDGSQREMSAAECAAVGSFPDGYRWSGRPAQVIQRIGNSVPPLLMRAVARHLREHVLRPRTADGRRQDHLDGPSN